MFPSNSLPLSHLSHLSQIIKINVYIFNANTHLQFRVQLRATNSSFFFRNDFFPISEDIFGLNIFSQRLSLKITFNA